MQVNEANQLQILEVLISAADGSQWRKREKDGTRRHAIVTSVCCAALAGLDVLAHKYRGELSFCRLHVIPPNGYGAQPGWTCLYI